MSGVRSGQVRVQQLTGLTEEAGEWSEVRSGQVQQLSGLTEEAGEWSQVRSHPGAAAERIDGGGG